MWLKTSFCLLALAVSVQAATRVANVARSGEIIDTSGDYSAAFSPSHLIDGQVGEAPNAPISYWLAPNGMVDAYFILDLRRSYSIESVRLFNTHNRQFNDRGTGNFELHAGNAVEPQEMNVDRYYSLDGDAVDHSGNGIDAVLQDFWDPFQEDVPAAVGDGQSLHLSGFGERLDIYDAPGMVQPIAYSISMWVKLQFDPGLRLPVGLIVRTASSGDETSSWSHQIRVNDQGQFEAYVFDGAPKTVIGTTVVEPDTWYHVAVTAENGGLMRLYVDGAEEGVPAGIATVWTGGTLWSVGPGSGGGFQPMVGNVDQLGLWFSSLSPDRIQNLSTGASPLEVGGARGLRLVNSELILSGTLSDVTDQEVIEPDTFTPANGLTPVTARYLLFRALDSIYGNDNVGLNEIEVYAAAELPVVAIAPAVQVFWPHNPFGAILETSPSLTDPVWTAVPVQPTLTGQNLEVYLPASTQAQFYRLLIPEDEE